MFKLIALLVLAVFPMAADILPTYNYFYSCDSGIVDCSNFPIHHYPAGPFALPTIPPRQGIGSATGFNIAASNSLGQAIGEIVTSVPTIGIPGYGAGGQANCTFFGGTCGDEFFPIDIDNNGIYLFSIAAAPFVEIGIGLQGKPLETLVHTSFDDLTFLLVQSAQGINDSDQILADVFFDSGGTSMEVRGVLSPFAVTTPEPSALLLLFTVVFAVFADVAIRRTRFR